MLFDLTSISGQRVAQVDELHLGGRQWVSSTNVFIGAGGAIGGSLIALLLRFTPLAAGQWWPFLLIPVGVITALVLFSRRRSTEGELNRRRIDRMIDKRHGMDGEFIRRIPRPRGMARPRRIGQTVFPLHFGLRSGEWAGSTI